MTTETTDTQLSQFDLMKQEANTKIATMTLDDIAGYIATLRASLDEYKTSNSGVLIRLQQTVDTITEFIKDNISDGADTDALKELANELEIELTKDLRITFTVQYYADVTVPLDYDVENIDESDFDIRIQYTGSDDVDFSDDSTEVEDFEVQEA